jgi:hypothetical protein
MALDTLKLVGAPPTQEIQYAVTLRHGAFPHGELPLVNGHQCCVQRGRSSSVTVRLFFFSSGLASRVC